MIWRINRQGKREQIKTKPGDVWYDGGKWKIQFPGGIGTRSTKKEAERAANALLNRQG